MIDLNAIKAQIAATLLQSPELAEDEDLRSDMLEGCTDIDQVLDRLVEMDAEASTMVQAIAARMADQDIRMKRYMAQGRASRAAIMTVMDAAGLNKFTLPEATLSVRKGVPRLIELDRDQTPPEYLKTVTEPVRNDIKAAILSGIDVPGWAVSNGEPNVSIRRK